MNTSCGVPEVDVFQFHVVTDHRHLKPKASGESYGFFYRNNSEDFVLLEYDAVLLGNLFPMFRRNMGLRTFKTLGTNYRVMWHHIPEEMQSYSGTEWSHLLPSARSQCSPSNPLHQMKVQNAHPEIKSGPHETGDGTQLLQSESEV